MKNCKMQKGQYETGNRFSWHRLLCHSLVRSENNGATAQTLLLFTGFFLLTAMCSCEKVISLKLNEAAKKLVIEGTVTNMDTLYPEVKISETKNFEADNSFVGVSGATVTIRSNNDTVYALTEAAPGIYRSTAFTGVPGFSYRLSVTLGGSTYTATSVLPLQQVTLDSLWAQNLAFAGSNNITIYPKYTDPPGPGNSYRLVEYKNGVQVNHVFEENDDLSDGLTITRPLINPDGDIVSGDTMRVDLQCIDKAVYRYWYSLDQSATGESQSATPTNPVSNIEGGALGYFSAYSITGRTLVVP